MIDQEDKLKGKQGESFFKDIAVRFFFNDDLMVRDPATGEHFSITDLRDLKREGEFALPDGRLIEVKSDFRCIDTGNIPVETSRNGRDGWFQYCQKNGVKHLIYFLYRNKAKPYPYEDVMFSFDLFASYVQNLMSSEAYMKKNHKHITDKDGTAVTFLLVSLKDAIHHCHPLVADSQIYEQDTASILMKSIRQATAKQGVHIDNESSLNQCLIQCAHGGEVSKE